MKRTTAQANIFYNEPLFINQLMPMFLPLELVSLARTCKYFHQLLDSKNTFVEKNWKKYVESEFSDQPKLLQVPASKSFFSYFTPKRWETYKELYARIYILYKKCERHQKQHQNEMKKGETAFPLENLFVQAMEQGFDKFPQRFPGLVAMTNMEHRIVAYWGVRVSLLQLAAFSGSLHFIKTIIENKADVNPNPGIWDCSTPLIKAAQNGHVECVRYLIEQKSQIDNSDAQGMTALWAAAVEDHVECVSALLKANADTEIRPQYVLQTLDEVAKGKEYHGLIVSARMKKGYLNCPSQKSKSEEKISGIAASCG